MTVGSNLLMTVGSNLPMTVGSEHEDGPSGHAERRLRKRKLDRRVMENWPSGRIINAERRLEASITVLSVGSKYENGPSGHENWPSDRIINAERRLGTWITVLSVGSKHEKWTVGSWRMGRRAELSMLSVGAEHG